MQKGLIKFITIFFIIITLQTVMMVPGEAALSGNGITGKFTKICAGVYHTVALKDDGTVWTWGHNGFGQLGDGATENRNAPVQVQGLSGVTTIAAGQYHTLAIKNDGTVWTWGCNNYGQLGDGTTTNRSIPVQVQGLNGIISIAGGQYHTVATKNDGTVWTWGYNNYGQLGNGTTNNSSIPVQVQGISNATAVAAGMYHTIALRSDGTVRAWGYNANGQLGDGTTADRYTPIQVQGLSGITSVTAGFYHSAALKNDGTIQAWGDNGGGQLGDGTFASKSTPIQVQGLSGITAIAGEFGHMTSLKNDGTVWTWGYNNCGQLEDGTFTNRSIPVKVQGLTGVTAIAVGGYHSVAIRDEGTAWTWGYNVYGELGDGTSIKRSKPIEVQGLNSITEVAGGGCHTIALMSNGTVWAWGYNSCGELGDGTSIQRSTPVQALGLSNVKAIAGGYYHTIALDSSGTVWTWGYNSHNELGDGTSIQRSTPIQVQGLSNVKAIAGGMYHTIALKNDGTVWTWGSNNCGQLGDGTTTNRSNPVQVQGLSGIISIAGGSNHTMALKNDGTVWAWGDNNYGQLGNGTTANSSIPVQVQGLSGISSIVGGYCHTVALKNDGTVWAWGNNNYGQLGNSTTINSSIPTQVQGINGVNAISTGTYHTAVLKNDGTVWTWGFNYYGQLGDGTKEDKHVPVKVTGLSGTTSISCGFYHTMALDGDKTVKVWGNDDMGQVGTGRIMLTSTPIQVNKPSATDITSIEPNSESTLISWNTIDQASSYNLKCNDNVIYSGSGTSYTNSGLVPNTKYTYSVQAFNEFWFSDWSTSISKYTLANMPSAASIKTESNDYIKVTWDANGNPAGTQYCIAVFDSDNNRIKQNNWTTNLYDSVIRQDDSTTYSIKIKARNQDGIETEWYDAVTSVAPIDNIKVESMGTHIILSWAELTGVTGYDVEVDGKIIDNGDSNIFDGNFDGGSKHIFRVRAKNNAHIGDWSSTVEGSAKYAILAPPQNINIIPAGTSISISWDAVNNAMGYDIEIDGQVKSVGVKTNYLHTSLKPQTQHTYRVRSRNPDGPGEWSPLQTVMTTGGTPGKPSNLTYVVTNTTATINWDAATDAETYDIVEVVNGQDGRIVDNSSPTTCEKRGLAPSSTHTYKIRAVNSIGAGEWSDPITITTFLLDTPSDIVTIESDTSIFLGWSAVKDATSYVISINGTETTTTTNVFTFTKLTPETKYTFRVKAVGVNGESSYSDLITTATTPIKPAVPKNVNATVSDTLITVTWDKVESAEGYDVELDGIVMEDDDDNIYIHDGLESDTMHTYRVRARNSAIEGDWSDMQYIKTLPGKPVVPKNIEIRSTTTGATLTWQGKDSDLSYDIKIYDGTKKADGTPTDPVIIENVAKSTYTHRRTALGQEYTYWIRTRNKEGVSDWSGKIINNAIKAKCTKNKTVDLGLTAKDVTDFSAYTMVVTYNASAVDVIDLSTLSGQFETVPGRIEGTDIEITDFTPGKITFKCDKVVNPGEAWTGVINSIKFKAKATGGTTITYTVLCKPDETDE